MILLYYEVLFAISMILTLCYAFIWHKHFDSHFTMLFCLIPIANLGYVLLAQTDSLEAALTSLKVIYIGGCYMVLFLMLSVFSLCGISMSQWCRAGCFLLSTLVYLSVLTIGQNDLFYRSVTLYHSLSGSLLVNKQYGPMHTVYYIMLLLFFAMSFGAMIYSYFKKKTVSHTVIYLQLIPYMLSLVSYFFVRKIIKEIELLPVCYVMAQFVYLLIIRRVNLYNITDSAIDSLIEKGETGFISFDFKEKYLGSNGTARKILPELSELVVDKTIKNNDRLKETLIRWLEDFRSDDTKNQVFYERDDRIYLVTINYLIEGHRKCGYQLFLTDDTKNQQFVSLLERYNTDLRSEVEQKTAHIVEMHDKLIMSMAMMVESRDNSTGGHIRRTSEVVRLLTDEMRKDPECTLSEEFCRDLIKAAPMHDLGKIAVDDAILRKPGRFTPEEFEKMKVHAAEGAGIVHKILDGTDDIDFHIIAENVAHYHHERWDGSGYPEGLKGEAIPLEARIMAIADVYDALVSKRVYKESMPFSQADQIILEGMGKQFDSSLERYYINARPKMEAYYSSTNAG